MSHFTPRLKSSLCVETGIRRYQQECIPCYVLKKGDVERGQIYLCFLNESQDQTIYTIEYDWDGKYQWVKVKQFLADQKMASLDWAEKLSQRDPDHWLLEIEDQNCRIFVPFPE